MVVVMEPSATEIQIERVISHLTDRGMDVHRSTGVSRTVLGVVGPGPVERGPIEVLAGVDQVLKISEPYKLASRTFRSESTVIDVGGARIGEDEIIVMAGPCAVESEEQIEATAAAVKQAGARMLRGGAFKPRSSPYTFQGLGEEGLRLLTAAARRHELPVVSEVMETSQLDVVCRYADVLQVGARNMQNFALLRALGQTRHPILLKRGISATIEEWLLSAEHILARGNTQVILCERGIRTFETSTRNTLDLCAVPVVKKVSHLPVVVDPSHGTGRRDKVCAMARAAVAVGTDGLLIEVHVDPDRALSDGVQSLTPIEFTDLMEQIRMVAAAVHRRVGAAQPAGPAYV